MIEAITVTVKMTRQLHPSLLLIAFISYAVISTETMRLRCGRYDGHVRMTMDSCGVPEPTTGHTELVNDGNYSSENCDGNLSAFSTSFEVVKNHCIFPHIPRTFLRKFRNLAVIILEGVKLESVKLEDFAMNRNVQTIALANNSLSELPSSLCFLKPKIRYLDFSSNRISRIDSTIFGDCHGLKYLYLNNNDIESIDVDFFENLRNLKILELAFNKLKTFASNLAQLDHLQFLSLSGNNIEVLDCNIYPRSSERDLVIIIEDNGLTNVILDCDDVNPYGMTIALRVGRNSLEHLTFPASNLTRTLRAVMASGNKISNVSIDDHLHRLTVLELNKNQLADHGVSDIFQYCHSLKELSLSQNKITKFDGSSFVKTPNPKGSSSRETGIRRIPFDLLSGVKKLWKLDLSLNQLTEFDFEVFRPQREYLHDIYLHGNKIKSLNGWNGTILPKLKILTISNNLLECDYLGEFMHKANLNITWTRNEYLGSNHSNVDGITCIKT